MFLFSANVDDTESYLKYRGLPDGDSNPVSNVVQSGGQPVLSIVVPAFNEAGRIERSIKQIDAFMRSSVSCELIVVDDGSRDNTTDIVLKAGVEGPPPPSGIM
jgi:cellulose synthase/poly-beta-1,6-N-acetylglucosamine synthase-like glycosyltransferase